MVVQRRKLKAARDDDAPEPEEDEDVNYERIRVLKEALKDQRLHYQAVIRLHEQANAFLKRQLREARGEPEEEDNDEQ